MKESLEDFYRDPTPDLPLNVDASTVHHNIASEPSASSEAGGSKMVTISAADLENTISRVVMTNLVTLADAGMLVKAETEKKASAKRSPSTAASWEKPEEGDVHKEGFLSPLAQAKTGDRAPMAFSDAGVTKVELAEVEQEWSRVGPRGKVE